jgi:hypothetical protein
MSALAPRDVLRRPTQAIRALNPRSAVPVLAVGLGLGLMALRFMSLGSAAFGRDEPQFLEAARQQILTGQWESVSPIPGNQGITYGASVVWFYGITERLLGPSPLPNIASMCLLVTMAQVVMIFAVSRAFHIGTWGCAVLLLFAASSAYQFFWARLAWDQLTDLLPFLVVALLCTPKVTPVRAALIGVLLGLGLSSHPMILPFLVVVIGMLLLENRRTPGRAMVVAGSAATAACLVCLPWFLSLSRDESLAGSPSTFSVSPGRMLEAYQTAGFWGFDYVLDEDWSEFITDLPLPGNPNVWGAVCLSAAAVLVIFGAPLLRSPDPAQRRVVTVMVVVAVLHPLFLDWRNTLHDPHYYFPLAWLPYVGAAAVLSRLRAAGPSARGALTATTVGIVAVTGVQLVFLMAFRGYIGENGGTQGVHYGTAVSLQRDAVRLACGRAGIEGLAIDNRTKIFEQALMYQIRTSEECDGRNVTVCHDQCPPSVPSATLVYREPQGGAVELRGP